MLDVGLKPQLLATPPLPRGMLRDIWRACGWWPTPLQEKILLSRARQRLGAAGRRVGKSQIGGYTLVPEAFRTHAELDLLRSLKQRREYWIVGPEYSDSEKEFRVVWNALEGLGFPFDRPGSYNNPLTGEMRISMFGGRFIIWAKSAKYPSTLVGEGLSGVVFAEAAKLKPSVYHKYLRPTLADFGGWATLFSTPEGRNWFYDFWTFGQDPDRPGWDSWRAPAWENPYVYQMGVDEVLLDALGEARKSRRLHSVLRGAPLRLEGPVEDVHISIRQSDRGPYPVALETGGLVDPEVWSMFGDMSDEMFNQEVAALFTEFVGRVFKNFDEEMHVTSDGLRAGWTTYACADYGFTNPFVWLLLQVDPHRERVHVVGEYYETERTTEEAATEISERGLAPANCRMFFPDPSEPDRTKVLANKLRIPGYRGGSIGLADRIEWIRRGLKIYPPHLDPSHPESGPALTIHRRCVNTIREMSIWKYKETAEKAAERGRLAPELPEPRHNHCPEALGRMYSGLFGSPWSEVSGARQHRAKVRR